MTFSILTIIIIITVGVSIMAFSNRAMQDKMLYIPYACKHDNQFYRTFSHLLIHADYAHLAFNMISLYFLGDAFLFAPCNYYQGVDCGLIATFGEFEGQAHFFALYLLGGLFATLIPYIRHHDNTSYRSLGASGAVSAVIFAAIIWNPGMELRLFFIPINIPAYIFGPMYLLYEYFADKRGNSGIAHDAHIGGALFGILYVLIINIDKGREFIGYFID